MASEKVFCNTDKSVNDMTEGRVGKTIVAFLIPMILTSILQQVYSIADTWVVGRGLGDDALGAVGNMVPLTFLIFGFSMGLTTGFAVVIGQKFGAKDIEGLKRAVASSIKLSVIIAAVITLISLTQLRNLMILIDTPEEVLEDSLKYGYIIFAGSGASIAYNLCSSVLRSLGDSKTPFYAIVFSCIFNFVFNWVSIFLLNMGIAGPAIVTVVSQVISVAILLNKLRSVDIIIPSRSDFRSWNSTDVNLLKNGIPMAVMSSITAVGCIIVQHFINGMGVAYTSAYSVCGRFLNLFMTPSSTTAQAISVFISQNYGSRKYGRLNQGFKMGILIAFITSVIFGVLMVFFPVALASRMLTGELQISLTAGFLKRCGIMLFLVNMMYIVRGACQGMGKPVIPMISGIAEMILRIVTVIVFVPRVGFMAAAYAEFAAWAGAFIMNGTAYAYYIRRLKEPGQSQDMADFKNA